MSGTSSKDDLRRRADHEAGHFVAAHALGVIAMPLWVSIQPRGESGGSVGLARKHDAPLIPTLQYLLAGIVGEAMGKLYRKHLGSSPGFQEIQDEMARGFVEAFHGGGHGDAAAIDTEQAKFPREAWPKLEDLRWVTLTLLSEHVSRFLLISDALMEHETLYGSEAHFLIMAHEKPEAERETHLKFLEHYRNHRIAVPAPEKWFDGASDAQRLSPFWEGPVEFFQRNLRGG